MVLGGGEGKKRGRGGEGRWGVGGSASVPGPHVSGPREMNRRLDHLACQTCLHAPLSLALVCVCVFVCVRAHARVCVCMRVCARQRER